MPLVPRLKLIVEIQSSLNGARPVSLGYDANLSVSNRYHIFIRSHLIGKHVCVCECARWTMMELVDSNGVLRDGWWRLPLFRSVPDPSLALEALGSHPRSVHPLPSPDRRSDHLSDEFACLTAAHVCRADALDIYVRVVRAGERQVQGRANPDNAAQYYTLEPPRHPHHPTQVHAYAPPQQPQPQPQQPQQQQGPPPAPLPIPQPAAYPQTLSTQPQPLNTHSMSSSLLTRPHPVRSQVGWKGVCCHGDV